MDKERTIADLIVERLHTWQVERVYGYPGDGNNPLMGALRRVSSGPEFIAARHEESAAFMAVGEAKYGDRVGVVTSTQGPGAVHLLNGLYDAKLDSAPVVALVAQQQRSVLGSGYQQEIDLTRLFADVASPFLQLVSTPEQLPMVIDRAFRSALANRKPAVVILPHDVQQAPVPELGQAHGEVVTAPRWTHGRVSAREEDVDQAVELLTAGEQVVLLVGQGCRGQWEQVAQLAERLGAGITTSLLGKPHVDESHPLVAGTMGHLGTTASAALLQDCDTLLILGSDDPWTEFYPPPGQARAIQVDVDPAVIGNRYPVAVGLVGHSREVIAQLSAKLPPHTPGWRERVTEVVGTWREISRRRAEVPAVPLNPELVVRELNQRLPGEVNLAVDVGSAVYHYVWQLAVPPGGSAHLSSTLASMGCAIPYALAAKEVAPQRPVVALAGDGAMEMLGNNELITLAQRWRSWADPRFVLVVLHNRDLAEVSWEQRETESEPRFEASQDVPRFDFAGYAELLGLHGMRVHDASALERVLDEAFTVERPVVVEVLTDPDVPLLPPFPHGRELLQSMREGLTAEGESGRHGLELLERYAGIEEELR